MVSFYLFCIYVYVGIYSICIIYLPYCPFVSGNWNSTNNTHTIIVTSRRQTTGFVIAVFVTTPRVVAATNPIAVTDTTIQQFF